MPKRKRSKVIPVMSPISEDARYVGARIFIARLHCWLTIGDLAQRTSIDVDVINAIECGAQRISDPDLLLIARVTKKSMSFFSGSYDKI